MVDIFFGLVSSLNIQTVLVGLIFVLIAYKLRQKFKYKLPPGPFGLPFIGVLDGNTCNHMLKYNLFLVATDLLADSPGRIQILWWKGMKST